jgi:CheY-like chemotaxis protein
MTTILVVDDRADMRLSLKSKLMKRGFTIVLASNGNEAVEACQRDVIDAIVMDMNMPELDGCEATEVLKAGEETKKIPIILCTAHPVAGDRSRAWKSGGDGFLEKPIAFESLISLLAKVLDADYEAVVFDEEPGVDSILIRTSNPELSDSKSTRTPLSPRTSLSPDSPGDHTTIEPATNWEPATGVPYSLDDEEVH